MSSVLIVILQKDNMTDSATIMELLMDQAESELTITGDAMYDDEDSTEDVEYEPVSQSDYAHMEDKGQPQNMNEEESTAFALDSQQNKRYKSFPLLQELQDLGLPLSFVIADANNKSYIGFVMGNGKTGTLVPVCIGRVMIDSTIGFTYFETFLNSDNVSWIQLYSHAKEGVRVEHHSVLNYGQLLPHLASLESHNITSPLPYGVVTAGACHMNALYRFV
jgi:hypothetical protein